MNNPENEPMLYLFNFEMLELISQPENMEFLSHSTADSFDGRFVLPYT